MAAPSPPLRGPALRGEAVASYPRPPPSRVHTSPTPPLSESPASAPRGRADFVRPPPDTSPRRTTTGATTTVPRRVRRLHITGAPHPVTGPRALRATSPHVRLSTAHRGPLTEPAGAGLRLERAWRVTDPSTSETMSTSGITSPLPMSKASLMVTHTHMGTRTHAPQGLPATGPLRLLTRIRVGCPMATAHHHLLRIGGDLREPPTLTTALPTPGAPARACTNLIARRTRTTGASRGDARGAA